MAEFDIKKTINELEKLASQVLLLKQEREQRRPLLIEFCGSPKSGKSTTITSLNIFLKRNGFKTVVLTERAGVCPIENKTHPFFNIWTLTSAISEIIKNLDQGKDKVDIIISDRGIFDALCWFKWLNTNPGPEAPFLDDESWEILEKFILMDMWTTYLDFVYVFSVRPETSIRREYANLLTNKRGSIMREQVLESFNFAVDTTIKQFGNRFRDVKKILTDTSDTDDNPNNVSYVVTKEILTTLHELLVEKIGYFKPTAIEKLVNGVNHSDLIKDLAIEFDNRDKIEKSNNIQPIPIVVFTNHDRNKVLVVKKGPRRTSKESPERDKLLMYIGGHIRKEDSKDNTFSTIKKTLQREIQEEIGESIFIKNTSPILLYTPENKISARHLGVCYIVEMDLDDKKFKLTSDEFVKKTGTSKSGHVLPVLDLVGEAKKMDSWSILIMNEVFNIDLTLDLFTAKDK